MSTLFTALFALFRSPAAKWLGLVLALAVGIYSAYLAVDSRATTRAEGVCAVALEDAQSQMLRDLIRQQEEAHQYHLAEVARGDALSAELSKTQRRLHETKTEYLAYANAITGHCPADLGVFMSRPSNSSSQGTGKNPAPSAPPDPSATVAASAIATNIAENRFRFEANFAQCSALLRWHEEGTVK